MLFDPLRPSAPVAPEPPFDGSSLDFLQATYRDPYQPPARRLRAAIAALPFEHPKLAVVARFDVGQGFAARLEEAIARSGEIIEVKPSAVAIESAEVL
jgi:hypothetical protein